MASAATAAAAATSAAPLPLADAGSDGAVKIVTLILPRDAASPELLASVFPPPLRATLAPDAAAERAARAAAAARESATACVYTSVSVGSGGGSLSASELALCPLLKDVVAPGRKLQILQARAEAFRSMPASSLAQMNHPATSR